MARVSLYGEWGREGGYHWVTMTAMFYFSHIAFCHLRIISKLSNSVA